MRTSFVLELHGEWSEFAAGYNHSDLEIHDTVLIAAAFCMYNRYVDGLDTWQPRDASMYAQMGQHLAEHGYLKFHDDGAFALIRSRRQCCLRLRARSHRVLRKVHWPITRRLHRRIETAIQRQVQDSAAT